MILHNALYKALFYLTVFEEIIPLHLCSYLPRAVSWPASLWDSQLFDTILWFHCSFTSALSWFVKIQFYMFYRWISGIQFCIRFYLRFYMQKSNRLWVRFYISVNTMILKYLRCFGCACVYTCKVAVIFKCRNAIPGRVHFCVGFCTHFSQLFEPHREGQKRMHYVKKVSFYACVNLCIHAIIYA